jgi:hypothetical protein
MTNRIIGGIVGATLGLFAGLVLAIPCAIALPILGLLIIPVGPLVGAWIGVRKGNA